MARVLFCWELGGDYGHLSRLLPIALELRDQGHEPLFAVRDLMGAEALLGPHGLPWYQAPLWIGRVTQLPPAINYAELLMRFGFLHAKALTGICRAWRHLIAALKPAALVLDHAPTALLATRGLGLPRLNLGDGFCIPPALRPMSPFRWWQRENMVRLRDSEDHAWKTANSVLFELDAPPLGSLGELAACDAQVLCTFPQLDHYPERPQADYAGPIFALGQGITQPWPPQGEVRIFAYLKAGYAELDRVLDGLSRSSARVLAHVPGAARQTLQSFTSPSMQLSVEPLDMAQMSAECDLAVCHGGAGTTAAMLLAGKPVLTLPMQLEQTMTGKRLEALGAGLSVPQEAAGQFSRQLKRTISDETFKTQAAQFAATHAGYDQTATIATATARCVSLMQ